MSRNIERLVRILEEERRREEERNPDLSERVVESEADANDFVEWVFAAERQGRISRERAIEALEGYLPLCRTHLERTEDRLRELNAAA